MRCVAWTVAAAALLLPSLVTAQIPLPSGNFFSDERKPAAKKADPVQQAQARLEALKAQLAAMKELASWASTNRTELANLYSDSLANLKQARTAIQRAKGATDADYVEPRGFEVEPIQVNTSSTLPSSSSTYSASVVPPDGFYLLTRVQFPEAWVKEKKRLSISYQIYPEAYLPMATTYQNTNNAIFRAYSSSLTAQSASTTFHAQVKGLSLPPGRYFASMVIAAYDSSRDSLVSLGMFRVDGKLLPTVQAVRPHYTEWYRTYTPMVSLTELKAEVKGKSLQIAGSYKREGFAKGQKPVWLEVVAEQGERRLVLLRSMQPLTAAVTKFGGKSYLIKEHALAPGAYTLRVTIFTEHPSSDSKFAYPSGSRSDKTAAITITGAVLAAPPPRAQKAKPRSEPLAKAEEEVKEAQKQVDQELLRLFSDQVQTGVYRGRLGILQREWQKLFAEQGPKPKARTYPTPAAGELAIDEAVGSDKENLEEALLTASCKKRRGCRIWARISFGKELVKKGGRFEFSAELKLKGGTTRYAVPAKEMVITGPSLVVDLPLDGIYLTKGSYEGTLRVLYGDRYKSKPLAFELIDTY